MIELWAAVVLAVTTPSQTAEPVLRPPVVTHFAWSREPRARLPREARDADIREGVVRLSCDVNASGAPMACTILSESQAGVGLGREALNAARRARLAESALRDVPENAQYHFDVVLR
jgi:TonB family protein